ncbi:MAG: DUF2169 domain-containing protein [Planctomycetota bacterium]
MNFANLTPFQPLHFESRDQHGTDHGVVVARGTFDIEADGSLRPADEQEPLVLADEYTGKPGRSSLAVESSLAPFKPRTDITFRAVAHSPRQKPARSWEVAVGFDARTLARFTVTGRRFWQRRLRGFRLTEPDLAREVPVTFERAFGGTASGAKKSQGAPSCWGPNPVGRGFGAPERFDEVEAPQLLPLDTFRPAFGVPFETVGLGPVAPTWEPRRGFVGTYDEHWAATRRPDLPADFDYRFYNTGARGMTLEGFAKGTETLTLTNLTPEGVTRIQLPGFELSALMVPSAGQLAISPAFLDTIHVDAVDRRVFLTWRAVVLRSSQLKSLELRLRILKGQESGSLMRARA